jgi:hypothetical protein
MNENLIEEENTVYEIDPDCQVESLKKEERRFRGQQWEGDSCCLQKKQTGEIPCLWIIVFLLCCFKQ